MEQRGATDINQDPMVRKMRILALRFNAWTMQSSARRKFYTVAACLFGAIAVVYSLGVAGHMPRNVEQVANMYSSRALATLIGSGPVLVMSHLQVWAAIYLVPILCAVLVGWSLYGRHKYAPPMYGRIRFPKRDIFGTEYKDYP